MPDSKTAPHESPATRIGRVIVRSRRTAGLTQEALASHLGVTKAAVSKWELGQSAPDIAIIPRIAAYFGITCDELLGYAEQLNEEERNRTVMELLDALKSDFEAGFDACKRTERAHWRDWPLLCQMSAALLNRALYHPDHFAEVTEYIEGVFERIEDECDDPSRTRLARMMRATVLMNSNQADRIEECIQLLESLWAEDAVTIPSLLATAYDQAGRNDEAAALRQRIVYISGTNAANECIAQLKYHEDNPQRIRALSRAARDITDALQLDAISPMFSISQFARISTALKNAGEVEDALEAVERLCALLNGNGDTDASICAVSPLGGGLFDVLKDELNSGAEFADQIGGVGADMLKNSIIATVVAGAHWDDCLDDPRYQALLALRDESYDAAAHWAQQEQA